MPAMRLSLFTSIIFAGLLLLASDLALLASHPAPQERPTFKAESELVVLHVSVRDRDGRYISGLERDAFTVIDDGKAQTLDMFSADEVPASVGFLIDNSNSMHPNRERVITSAVEFAKHSHPKDEIFVVTFNETVRPAFGPVVVGEMNMGVFGSAMSQAITARGMTAIYDGILDGLKRVGKGQHTRQVLIVVSDGGDNASLAPLDSVIRRVHEADATIYTVALIDPLTRDGDQGLLQRLSQVTGGESYAPRRVEEIAGAFEKIARDIRSAYTLAYTPTAAATSSRDGGPRRRTVRVYVRPIDGRALRVRTRSGYFEKTRGATP
jgi:Ca-activated chloride channel family protein